MFYSIINKRYYLIYKPFILIIVFVFTTYIINNVGTRTYTFIDLSPLVFIFQFFVTFLIYLISFVYTEFCTNMNVDRYLVKFTENLFFTIYVLFSFYFVREDNFLIDLFYMPITKIDSIIFYIGLIILILVVCFIVVKNFFNLKNVN